MSPQELSVKTKRINEQSKCHPQALLENKRYKKRYKTITTYDIQMNPKTTRVWVPGSVDTPGFMCTHRQTFCTMHLVFAGYKTRCVGFPSYSKVSFVFLGSLNALPPFFSLPPASSLCHATHFYIESFSQCARRTSGHHRQLTHICIVLYVPLLRPVMKKCLVSISDELAFSLRHTDFLKCIEQRTMPEAWATIGCPARLHRYHSEKRAPTMTTTQILSARTPIWLTAETPHNALNEHWDSKTWLEWMNWGKLKTSNLKNL